MLLNSSVLDKNILEAKIQSEIQSQRTKNWLFQHYTISISFVWNKEFQSVFFKIYGYAVHDYTLPAIGYVHRTLIRDTL